MGASVIYDVVNANDCTASSFSRTALRSAPGPTSAEYVCLHVPPGRDASEGKKIDGDHCIGAPPAAFLEICAAWHPCWPWRRSPPARSSRPNPRPPRTRGSRSPKPATFDSRFPTPRSKRTSGRCRSWLSRATSGHRPTGLSWGCREAVQLVGHHRSARPRPVLLPDHPVTTRKVFKDAHEPDHGRSPSRSGARSSFRAIPRALLADAPEEAGAVEPLHVPQRRRRRGSARHSSGPRRAYSTDGRPLPRVYLQHGRRAGSSRLGGCRPCESRSSTT